MVSRVQYLLPLYQETRYELSLNTMEPVGSSSVYHDEDQQGFKKEHNTFLVELTRREYSESFLKLNGRAFYLDGPCLGSTDVFQNVFSSLWIPQWSKDDYNVMYEKLFPCPESKIRIEHCTVRQMMEAYPDHIASCQMVYLDMMQCIYGSIDKKSYPLHDLDQLLKLTQQNTLILGFTAVSRMYIPQNLHHSEEIQEDIKYGRYHRFSSGVMWHEFIQPVILSRGWNVATFYIREYCKDVQKSAPMVFFGLTLKRQAMPLSMMSKQVFHMHPSRVFRLGFDQDFEDEKQCVRKSSGQYKTAYKKYYHVKKQQWTLPFTL